MLFKKKKEERDFIIKIFFRSSKKCKMCFFCVIVQLNSSFQHLSQKFTLETSAQGEHSFAASWCRPFKSLSLALSRESLSLSLSVLFVFVFFFVKDLRNGVAR